MTDPLNLADGTSVLFIDQNNINCDDSYSREQALNPLTPWCSLLALREGNEYNSNADSPKIEAGDTIYIKEGTYTSYLEGEGVVDELTSYVVLKTSGTEENPINIMAYPGDTVTIRGGRENKSTTSDPYLLCFSGVSHLKITNLDFIGYVDSEDGRRYMGNLLKITSRYPYEDNPLVEGIEIENCSFWYAFGNDDIYIDEYIAMKEAGTISFIHGNLVFLLFAKDSYIRNINVIGTAPGLMTLSEQRLIEGDGVLLNDCENIVVEDSFFYGLGHDDFHSHRSQYITIQNNFFNNIFHNCIDLNYDDNYIIRNNVFYNWNLYPSESSLAGIAIEVLCSSYNKIYNNIIYNSEYRGAAVQIIATIGYVSNDNEVYNNTIYNSGSSGIMLFNGIVNGNVVSNNKIHNNIIYGLKRLDQPDYSSGLLHLRFNDFFENNGYGNEFYNNMISNFDNSPLVVTEFKPSNGSLIKKYDLESFQTRYPFAVGNISEKPLFVDANNGDFNLAATTIALLCSAGITEMGAVAYSCSPPAAEIIVDTTEMIV